MYGTFYTIRELLTVGKSYADFEEDEGFADDQF